ncbi:hypothetical protein V1527DRAFT_498170 [Lipomyces starkeyi]
MVSFRARVTTVSVICRSIIGSLYSSIHRPLFSQTIPSPDVFTWYACFHSFTLFLLHHPGNYASTSPQSSIESQKKLRQEFYEMAALLSLSGILGDVVRIVCLSLPYVVHMFLLQPLLNYSIRQTKKRC